MLKLSIALVTYNHEKFVGEALDSILTQEIPYHYEIVIGEDYSTDSTRSIVMEYQNRYPDIIKVTARGKNVGYTKNFFDVLLNCKGEYIAILDGDDLMLPGKLAKQIDFLDSNMDCVMVGHLMEEFEDGDNKVNRIVGPPVIKERYLISDFLAQGSVFGNSSKMFRRSAINFDNSDQKIHLIADMYLTLMVVGRNKAGWINEVLGRYRRHSGAIMRNLNGKKVYDDEMFTLSSVKEVFGDEIEIYFGPRMAHASLAYGMHEINNGNKKNGRKLIQQSIRYKPSLAPSQYIYLVLSYMPDSMVKLYRKINSSR